MRENYVIQHVSFSTSSHAPITGIRQKEEETDKSLRYRSKKEEERVAINRGCHQLHAVFFREVRSVEMTNTTNLKRRQKGDRRRDFVKRIL